MIPKFGAVPLALAVVITLHTQNVAALPQFSVFPGFGFQGGFRQTFQPFIQPIQNFQHNVVQPLMEGVMHMIMGHDHSHEHKFVDDGTESPQATGHDEQYPRDCGRDPEKGTGKLCFPDGLLCQQRVSKAGVQRFGNHYYYFSWLDTSDRQLQTGHWSWFNARNYCRKRCMDLVSFETPQEDCVILTGVTDRTCSPRTLTDGSGPPTRWPWPPPTPPTGSTTGPTLEAWGSSSQITGRRSNSTGPPSHVWQFSTIITEMGSNGTTLPALMRSRSFVKMLKVILVMQDSSFLKLEFPRFLLY